jgi:putative ABC transport system permease protein
MRMILVEAVILSATGAALGALGAVLLYRLLAELPSASGIVSGRISPLVIAQGFALALVVGFLGGLYPALRGSRLPPTEALRHE